MEVHTFNKGISPKVNVVKRSEFELANYDVAVQNVSHYTTGTRQRVDIPLNNQMTQNYERRTTCNIFSLDRVVNQEMHLSK